MLVQFLLGEKLVTPRVRFLEPLDLMNKLYNVTYEEVENMGQIPLRADTERFLIRARTWNSNPQVGIQMPKALYEQNYLMLHELDDHPDNWKGYTNIKGLDFLGSHAVTTSTEAMRDALKEYNPYVKVFHNQIATLLPQKVLTKKNTLRIFFGALNRQDSWRDIMPVINNLAAKYGEHLHFTVISDKAFFSELNTPHKEFIGDDNYYGGQIVPLNVYMNCLNNSDIALLPLADNKINRCKSDLKFIECANAGVVAICSPVVYEKTVRDGETGFIYRYPREFAEKFETLIANQEKRIDMAKNAYEYVKRERLLKDHIEERYEWMKELYAKREEVHKRLLLRLAKYEKKYLKK
ncbi:MAG: glycosyltransferase [Selenomonadaceae bacterium]|nr:glycosyltransferase [Selenomonadaceae bacterium]